MFVVEMAVFVVFHSSIFEIYFKHKAQAQARAHEHEPIGLEQNRLPGARRQREFDFIGRRVCTALQWNVSMACWPITSSLQAWVGAPEWHGASEFLLLMVHATSAAGPEQSMLECSSGLLGLAVWMEFDDEKG